MPKIAREILEKLADSFGTTYEIRRIDQAIKELDALVPHNPYPEDIFIEPTKEQYALFHKILQEHGLTLDKFSGALGRRIWKSFTNEIHKIFR